MPRRDVIVALIKVACIHYVKSADLQHLHFEYSIHGQRQLKASTQPMQLQQQQPKQQLLVLAILRHVLPSSWDLLIPNKWVSNNSRPPH